MHSNVKDLAQLKRDATKQAKNLAYSNYINGGRKKSNGIKKGCVRFGDFSISNMGKTHEGEFMNLSRGEGSNFGGEKSDVYLGQWDALNTQLEKHNTGRTMENDNTHIIRREGVNGGVCFNIGIFGSPMASDWSSVVGAKGSREFTIKTLVFSAAPRGVTWTKI